MAAIRQPLSWQYRLVHGHIMPPLMRLSCHYSDMVLCLNREEAEYLKRHWTVTSRIVITSNSVEPEFYTTVRINTATFRLLFIGQWLEMKGIRYLVEAFTRVARSIPGLELWCVGTQKEAETVQADFPEELRSRVVVRPRASRSEILSLLAEAEIFVFPSLSEGSSNALLEAMAAGLPIVTTAVGAAPDMLDAEIDALFVPERDADALVNAVRRLISDPTLRERLGQSARAIAAEYHTHIVDQQYLKTVTDAMISQRLLAAAKI